MLYVVDKQEEETGNDMASSDSASDSETGSEAEVKLLILLLGYTSSMMAMTGYVNSNLPVPLPESG